MKKLNFALLLAISSLVFLPACLKYTPTQLRVLDARSAEYTESKSGVTVCVKRLDKKTSQSLFDGRGSRLADGKEAITPIQICVENNTRNAVVVKPASIAITEAKIISNKVSENVAGIATGSVIGGLLLAGPVGAIAMGTGFGVRNAQINDEILLDIEKKSLLDRETIPAQDIYNKIMYVRSSEVADFKLSVGSQKFHVKFA